MATKWKKLVERQGDFWKNYMMIISLYNVKNIFGFTLQEHLTTRKNKNFTHWMSPNAVRQFSLQVEQKIQHNSHFIDKIYKLFLLSQKNLTTINYILGQTDLRRLSNKQLQKLFQNFCKKYLTLYSPFHIGIYNTTIEEEIESWLTDTLNKRNEKNKFDEYFIKLTTPERLSLLEQEKIDLLSIALQIKKTNNKEATLNQHIKKYAGLPVIHDDIKPWSRSYFTRRLNDFLKKDNEQLQNQRNEILQIPLEVKENKKNLFLSLSIPTKIQQFCSFIGQSTWIRLSGRQTFSLAHHASKPLFNEIGKRFNLTIEDVKWLNPEEILQLIENQTLPKTQKLKQRKKISALLFRNNQHYVFEGEKAKQIIKKELKGKDQQVDQEKSILNGKTAFPGLISGKAKIVLSQKEINKIKNGNRSEE